MAYGRGASLSDAADRGAKRAPMTEAMPTQSSGELERGAWDAPKVINNDFHPVDSGLNATEDHWGEKK